MNDSRKNQMGNKRGKSQQNAKGARQSASSKSPSKNSNKKLEDRLKELENAYKFEPEDILLKVPTNLKATPASTDEELAMLNDATRYRVKFEEYVAKNKENSKFSFEFLFEHNNRADTNFE